MDVEMQLLGLVILFVLIGPLIAFALLFRTQAELRLQVSQLRRQVPGLWTHIAYLRARLDETPAPAPPRPAAAAPAAAVAAPQPPAAVASVACPTSKLPPVVAEETTLARLLAAKERASAEPEPPCPVLPPRREPVAAPARAMAHPQPSSTPPAPPKAGRDIEIAIGTGWASRVGMVIVLLAAVVFLKLAFDRGWIDPGTRVAMGALLGLGVMVAGEFVHRRGFSIQGQVLTGGGAALLYLTLWAALRHRPAKVSGRVQPDVDRGTPCVSRPAIGDYSGSSGGILSSLGGPAPCDARGQSPPGGVPRVGRPRALSRAHGGAVPRVQRCGPTA